VNPRLALVAALVAACCAPATPAGARTQVVRWFHSPSGNIECEVAARDSRGTYAYCQTFRPLQTATLRRNGHTTACTRGACPVGNGPENARTLAYGRSIVVGPFRCSSSRLGVRCVLRASGHGFAIARAGVKRF
jgi:hypothetical protein